MCTVMVVGMPLAMTTANTEGAWGWMCRALRTCCDSVHAPSTWGWKCYYPHFIGVGAEARAPPVGSDTARLQTQDTSLLKRLLLARMRTFYQVPLTYQPRKGRYCSRPITPFYVGEGRREQDLGAGVHLRGPGVERHDSGGRNRWEGLLSQGDAGV